MKYLKLEVGKSYPIEFISQDYELLSTPYGPRYNYKIKHDNEEMLLRATDKLRMQIEFYFKMYKNNNAILSVFNGGNHKITFMQYNLIPNQ